jgi:hypothetical protein
VPSRPLHAHILAALGSENETEFLAVLKTIDNGTSTHDLLLVNHYNQIIAKLAIQGKSFIFTEHYRPSRNFEWHQWNCGDSQQAFPNVANCTAS